MRFINPDNTAVLDVQEDLYDKNLYAYCDNNPVVRYDMEGDFWHLLIGAVVGTAIQYVSDVLSNVSEGKEGIDIFKPSSTVADYAGAALSGALAASSAGKAVSVIANAAINGAVYLADCDINNEAESAEEFAFAIATGAVAGRIGGSGADGAKMRGIYSTANRVIKSSSSSKKIAMYVAKKQIIRNNVVKSVCRAGVAVATVKIADAVKTYAGRRLVTQ